MIKLIPEWKKCHQFLSVQLAVAFSLLSAAYEYLPLFREVMPDGWHKWAVLIIVVGRIVSQQKTDQSIDPK